MTPSPARRSQCAGVVQIARQQAARAQPGDAEAGAMAPAMQSSEFQFAQRLASSEKGVRDRAVRKLRQYLSARTQSDTGEGPGPRRCARRGSRQWARAPLLRGCAAELLALSPSSPLAQFAEARLCFSFLSLVVPVGSGVR